MSIKSLSSTSSFESSHHDILSSWNIYSKYVLNFTKESSQCITNEERKNCKVINFSFDWTFEEILSELAQLDAKIFKNTFIFVINVDELDNEESQEIKNLVEEVVKSFNKSWNKRLLIIQLTSEDEETEIYYRNGSSDQINEIPGSYEENKEVEDFPTFMSWYLKENSENCEDLLTKFKSINGHLDQLAALRFIGVLDLEFESLFDIASFCAANYSKAHFFAALGVSFEDDGRILNQHQSNLITILDEHGNSILQSAISNKNPEVLKYLTSSCSHLIHRLPFFHQQTIIKQLKDENNLNILCDLLEFCDFPFPNGVDFESIQYERFDKIIVERDKFHAAVEKENYEEINKFIETSNLRFVYNDDNDTALYTALVAGNFDIYFLLLSLGFKEDDCDEWLENLDDQEKIQFNKAKSSQMANNLKESETDENKAVNLLAARSKIYGKQEGGEREKIRGFYQAINKIEFGSSLLNAVAQCRDLEIIFDFECDDVARVDLDSANANGIMYPSKRLVIIGAKHLSSEQEQKVKGYLAHELFHYAMRIIFEFAEQPYLNKSDERYQEYKKIVEKYKNEFITITENGKIMPTENNDGCDEIISSVFRLYDEDEFDAELIVRMVQIFAQYDDDPVKIRQLKERYEDLYQFLVKYVIPFMDRFNMYQRELVRNFNKFADLLAIITKQKFNFSVKKDLESSLNKKLVILRANIPRLLLINFYNHLYAQNGQLVDAMNVFISQEKFLINPKAFKELCDFLKIVNGLNIFIDFSGGNHDLVENFPLNSSSNFFFIVSNSNQSTEFMQIISNKKLKAEEIEINYEWNDLEGNAQRKLLKSTVNFQNNPDIRLSDLLMKSTNLSFIINAEVLNAILRDLEILINTDMGHEIGKADYFDQVFRNRSLIYNNQQITQQQLIENTKNRQFILISDIAGTGKSWIMRKMSQVLNTLNQTKWVTFVDLKKFISTFKECSEQSKVPKLQDFIARDVLKSKSKIEVEIFKLKYETGEALIFFDGFDEIAPDCANFVKELLESFKSNKSNQLWIATRDLFEVDLQEHLNDPFTCKLSNFTEEDGINLIASIWRLHDLQKGQVTDFPKYLELATQISIKLIASNLNDIGHPLLYKMIAEITKISKAATFDSKMSSYQLLEEFSVMSYNEWSQHKGKIRTDKNAESQKLELTCVKLHQLKAMQKFMPGLSNYCDIDPDEEEDWTEVDLVGCGLMTKKDDNFFFIHEIFKEFFVAHFIVRVLCKTKVDPTIFEFIQKVILDPKNHVIRQFLNEALKSEKKIQSKLDEKARKIALKLNDKKVDKFQNFLKLFTEILRSFDELGRFLILILKHWNRERTIQILTENVRSLISKDKEITQKSQKIFVNLIISRIENEMIKEVLVNITENHNFINVKNLFNFSSKSGETIFYALLNSNNCNEAKFEKFINFWRQFFSADEIAAKMKQSKTDGQSIIHTCIQYEVHNLKTFWPGMEKFFEAENRSDEFNDHLMEKLIYNHQNILHSVAHLCEYVEFHEAFWQLLLKTFENQLESLKNFILTPDGYRQNFLHLLVQYNNNPDVLEFTLSKLKKTFNKSDFQEIFKAKGFEDENLFHYAARHVLHLIVHKILWTFMLESFEPKEIFEFLLEANFYGQNPFHLIAMHSTVDIFNFFFQELRKVLSYDQVKSILRSSDKWDRNILQITYHPIYFINDAEHNDNVSRLYLEFFDSALTGIEILPFNPDTEAQKSFWSNLLERFRNDEQEIKKILLKETTFGSNHIHQLLRSENATVVELAFDFFVKNLSLATLKDIFDSMDVHGWNLLQCAAMCINHAIYTSTWKLMRESFDSNTILKFLSHKNRYGNNLFLHIADFCSREAAEYTWNQVDEIFENAEQEVKNEIIEIIKERSVAGENVLHLCVRYDTVEFTKLDIFWKRIQTKISDFKSFVMQRYFTNEKTILLQIAEHCKIIEIHELLWELLLETFEDREELRNFLLFSDNFGNNFIHYLIQYNNTKEVLDFTLETLRKTFSEDIFDEILQSKGLYGWNILFLAIRYSKYVEVHRILWQHVLNSPNSSRLVTEVTLEGTSIFLFIPSYEAPAEVLDTICEALKNKTELRESVRAALLSLDNLDNNVIIGFANTNGNLELHKSLWRLMEAFLSLDDIKRLINHFGFNKSNALQESVRWNIKSIVEFTWDKIKKVLNKSEQDEYLRRTNLEGLSLIQIAAKYTGTSEQVNLTKELLKSLDD